jgi:hypothetical protein
MHSVYNLSWDWQVIKNEFLGAKLPITVPLPVIYYKVNFSTMVATRSITNETQQITQVEVSQNGKLSVPLFTPITAPRITSIAYDHLVVWKRARTEYEEQVKARCQATGEDPERILVTVKNSFDDRMIRTLCKFQWKTTKEELTEEALLGKIEEILSKTKNGTIPDIEKIMKDHLKMDLRQTDVNARIAEYFNLMEDVIEKHALTAAFGGTNGVKRKVQILTEQLAPKELRFAVQHDLKYEKSDAKADEIAFYDLVLGRALEQDREFQRLRKNTQDDQGPRKRPKLHHSSDPELKVRTITGTGHNPLHQRHSVGKVEQRAPPPPKDGCLKCQGPHRVHHCPSASENEKKTLLQAYMEKKKQKGHGVGRQRHTP